METMYCAWLRKACRGQGYGRARWVLKKSDHNFGAPSELLQIPRPYERNLYHLATHVSTAILFSMSQLRNFSDVVRLTA